MYDMYSFEIQNIFFLLGQLYKIQVSWTVALYVMEKEGELICYLFAVSYTKRQTG